jgi:hypothetical protein
VTPDAVLVADERMRAVARLRGAAQALNVLQGRSPAEQQRASLFAMSLLGARAAPADWTEAGLPEPPAAGQAAGAGRPARCSRLPLDRRAVVLLARTAMALYAAGLRISERPGRWERLAGFFADRLPEADPELIRLRERVLAAQVDAGDTSAAVFSELTSTLDFHRDEHGENAYLTSIAQTNLAKAFRRRGAANEPAGPEG